MANVVETGSFDPTVPLVAVSDAVLGGDGTAPANRQAQALANRTGWLKGQLDSINSGVAALATGKADKTYVDSQDAATLAAAKAYADNSSSAAAAAALAAAKAYADSVGASILGQAKAYADAGDIATRNAANARADAGDAGVLAAANAAANAAYAHADAVGQSVLAQANAYALAHSGKLVSIADYTVQNQQYADITFPQNSYDEYLLEFDNLHAPLKDGSSGSYRVVLLVNGAIANGNFSNSGNGVAIVGGTIGDDTLICDGFVRLRGLNTDHAIAEGSSAAYYSANGPNGVAGSVYPPLSTNMYDAVQGGARITGLRIYCLDYQKNPLALTNVHIKTSGRATS